MAAMTDEQIVTVAKGSGQIESFNAATGAAPCFVVSAQDDGRAIKGLEDAGGHDADHTDMPEQLAFDDDKILRWIEAGPNSANHLLGDIALDFLAFPILRIKTSRHIEGFCAVFGQEQLEGLEGVFQPASGIEPGSKLKADFISADWFGNLRDLFQSDQAWPRGLVKAFDPFANEDAIFTGERNEVGNCAESDQVQRRAQVEFFRGRHAGFA